MMRKILNDVTFHVLQGETVALVGHSGAGKTTLADLLIRLYDVSEGEIKIDNHNIKDIRLSTLRNLMGVVSQESIYSMIMCLEILLLEMIILTKKSH